MNTMGVKKGLVLLSVLVCSGVILGGCGYHRYRGAYSEEQEQARPARSNVYVRTQTVPGFELPKSQPTIWVVLPTNPTVMDKKLQAHMKAIVVNQGGRVAIEPDQADLVLAVFSGEAERLDSWVENLTMSTRSSSFTFSGGHWGVSSTRTDSTVPVARQETRRLTTVAINLFVPDQAKAGGKLELGWRAELQVEESRFYEDPMWFLNLLFEYLGSKDQAGEVTW